MPIRKRPGRNCYKIEGIDQRPETCLTRAQAERQYRAVLASRAERRNQRRRGR